MITCFISYEIDPYKGEEFSKYAKNWGRIIPRCGADLIGYFGPYEGSATRAYGIYNIENLTEYEAYRARLRRDEEGLVNFEYAKSAGFIRREDRIFIKALHL